MGIMSDRQLSPKLVVGSPGTPGTADAAVEFYRQVLGAELGSRYAMGNAVVFASLTLPGGGTLQVKDADGTDPGPASGGGGVILDLVCDDPDAVLARAVQHGAEVVFPVDDQPYGSRQGRFRDPFGHQWIIGTPIAMSDAEIQSALDAWTAQGGPGS